MECSKCECSISTDEPSYEISGVIYCENCGRKAEHLKSLEDAYDCDEGVDFEKEPEYTYSSALDVQVGGSHYKDFKIQPVEFIHKNNIGFLEGNCIKYLCRHKNKNGIEDLKKVKHYIDLLIEMEYGKESDEN